MRCEEKEKMCSLVIRVNKTLPANIKTLMVKCDSKCNQLKGTIYDNQQVKRLTKTAGSYVQF